MKALFQKTLKDHHLLPPGAPVLLACSGGVDSMVLLDLLRQCNVTVSVAHVNHKKRTASDEEEIFLKDFCLKRHIPFYVKQLSLLDDNFHDKAHHERYAFFIKTAKENNIAYIATAHHSDDQIETILWRLLRGSTLNGHAGIAMKRLLEGVSLIRPLLHFKKQDLLAYAKITHIEYRHDDSNDTPLYTRNRLRKLIEHLKDEQPQLNEKANQFSQLVHSASNYIREQSLIYLKNHDNTIEIPSYLKLHDALKRDVIIYLFEEKQISFNQTKVEDALRFICIAKPNATYDLSSTSQLIKKYDRIQIGYKRHKMTGFCFQINDFGTYELPDGSTLSFTENFANENTKQLKLCYNKRAFPFFVRNRQDGDFFVLSFGRKKVKDLLIDLKIPAPLRDSLPIVTNAEGDILWMPGIAVSEQTKSGQKHLYITYRPKE